MIWDTHHAIRDFVLAVLWGLALGPVLGAVVTLYGAGWWEGANASARWEYGKLGLPWEWRRSEWGDMASSAVGVTVAALLVAHIQKGG